MRFFTSKAQFFSFLEVFALILQFFRNPLGLHGQTNRWMDGWTDRWTKPPKEVCGHIKKLLPGFTDKNNVFIKNKQSDDHLKSRCKALGYSRLD